MCAALTRSVAARMTRVVLWLTLLACDDPPRAPQRFALTLEASTPAHEPVSGARFFAGGTDLGVTSERGELVAKLTGRDGDALLITTNCPSGYRTLAPPRTLRLHSSAGAAGRQLPPLHLQVACEREQRTAALVVRALHGEQRLPLPIRVDGELLGQTDVDGLAHMLVAVSPHHNLRVALDTSAFPRLRPRDPVRTFQVDEEQDVLLFDQSFSDEPVRARGPKPTPRRHTPYRIR
jgi:hypothetical protein